MQSFLARHKGYNLKRILKEGGQDGERALTRGGLVWLKASSGAAPARASDRLLFGMSRAQAHGEAYGSALSLLFSTPRPRLGLSRIQQQVLLLAVDDLSDEEIADHLGLSGHAVNMRWRTIYDRVNSHPKLAAAIFHPDDGGRGHGHKRRRVVAFARAHPEELRPFAGG